MLQGDRRIYFDQDYSFKLQKERSQYVQLQNELREKGVKSHLIYPAKLKVFGNGGSLVYESAREAAAALRAQGSTSKAPHPPMQDYSSSSNQAWPTGQPPSFNSGGSREVKTMLQSY